MNHAVLCKLAGNGLGKVSIGFFAQVSVEVLVPYELLGILYSLVRQLVVSPFWSVTLSL